MFSIPWLETSSGVTMDRSLAISFRKFVIIIFILNTFVLTSGDILDLPCSSAPSQCGQPIAQPASVRIIGGHEAQQGAWPWTVYRSKVSDVFVEKLLSAHGALFYPGFHYQVSLVDLGYHSCGGSIVTERFILTAAHCFDGESNDPNRWQIIAGKHDLLKIEPGQKVVKVKNIILHEQYDNVTAANDIALVELSESLTFNTIIRPICLPTADQGVSTGELCLLAGWGQTRGTADYNVLNQVILPIISDDTCAQDDWYGKHFVSNITFCAGYEMGGKDSCTGDSGGPLICLRGDKWFEHGIASWGYGCAEYKWPGIYTDVSVFSDWIRLQIAENNACDDGVIG